MLNKSMTLRSDPLSPLILKVTPITRLGLPRSTYQLSNTINPPSSYFKSVTASECGDQIAFCSRLKTKKWSNIPSKTSVKPQPHGSMGRATDLHSGGRKFEFSRWTEFFLKINIFCIHVLALITLLLGIPSMHWNGTWAKLNACHLGTRICWWLMNWQLLLFIHYSMLKALV